MLILLLRGCIAIILLDYRFGFLALTNMGLAKFPEIDDDYYELARKPLAMMSVFPGRAFFLL